MLLGISIEVQPERTKVTSESMEEESDQLGTHSSQCNSHWRCIGRRGRQPARQPVTPRSRRANLDSDGARVPSSGS
jgi:hypothetical protein